MCFHMFLTACFWHALHHPSTPLQSQWLTHIRCVGEWLCLAFSKGNCFKTVNPPILSLPTHTHTCTQSFSHATFYNPFTFGSQKIPPPAQHYSKPLMTSVAALLGGGNRSNLCPWCSHSLILSSSMGSQHLITYTTGPRTLKYFPTELDTWIHSAHILTAWILHEYFMCKMNTKHSPYNNQRERKSKRPSSLIDWKFTLFGLLSIISLLSENKWQRT